MANVKITDLTALSASDVASVDVLPIVDVDADQTKKISISDLITSTSASNDFITFTRLNANINVLDANADAIEARRVANVTVMTDEDTALQARLTTNVNSFTTEDTALQARLTTNVTAFSNEDTALQSRLTTNVTAFTTEDTGLQARLTTNVTAFSNEDTALQARLTTNVTAFSNEDTALQARIAANTLSAASNDFITFTRLNANINVVQDNVASVTVGTAADTETRLNANLDVVQDNVAAIINGTTNFTGEVTMNDDLIVAGNLTINGATTTANSINLVVEDRIIMLANSVTGSPSADVGLLFNRGNQGNAALFYDESGKTFKFSDTKDPSSNTSLSPVTASNLDVGSLTATTVKFNGADLNTAITNNVTALTNEDTALQARLTTNVTAFSNEDTALQARLTTNATAFTNEDTALQARLTTNVTAFSNEDTALQARITANTATAASNDLITFTRLNANINVVQANVVQNTANINVVSSNSAGVEARRVANIAGGVSTILTADLTASRALVSSSGGKVEVSAITSTELGHLDGIDQNINSNLVALAAGIVGASVTTFPTGDYGLLDTANQATDAFSHAIASFTEFDMLDTPSGSLGTEDLGALT